MKKDYWMDKTNYKDPIVLKRVYRERFQNDTRTKRIPAAELEHMDYDFERMSRRMDTALSHVEEVRKKMAPFYPYYDGATSFEDDWAYINSLFMDGYDYLNQKHNILLGAAYWILDHLNKPGVMYEAEKDILFQVDEREWDDDPIIYNEDVCYSYEHLQAVMHILIHRNDDCKMYRKKSSMKRLLMDEATVKRKQHQDVPSRKLFEKLIGKLDKSDIEESVSIFKNTFWELAEKYFSALKDNHEKRYRQILKHDRMIDRIDNFLDSAGSNIVKKKNNQLSFAVHVKPNLEVTQEYLTYRDMNDEVENAMDEVDYLVRQKEDFTESAWMYCYFAKKDQERMYPASYVQLMENFRIKDPYAICFALLYLIDNDDDMPWLYYFSHQTISAAIAVLPWRDQKYDSLGTDLYLEELQEKYKWEDNLTFLHEMTYEDGSLDEVFRDPKTIAQLLYEYTGVTIPREESSAEYAVCDLKNYGFSSRDLDWFKVLIRMADALKTRRNYFIDDETANLKKQTAESNDAEQALSRQVKTLQIENKELNTLLRGSQRELKEEQKKCNSLESDIKANENELQQLREYLFSNMNEPEVQTEPDIKLPVEMAQRIVIVGGHDSWLKQVKPMLKGNVRYSANVKINDLLIQNCDEVWIQTNAISHSDYYKVTDLCRKNGIPFYYFQNASAKKCVMQIYKNVKEKQRYK